jgi:hypothetical protein
MVTLPDSTGIWLLVAPTPGTTQWKSGSHLVCLGVEPVLLLQWVTLARKLLAGEVPVTPKLSGSEPTRFIMLGKNPRNAGPQEEFALAAIDSVSETRWMTFASKPQVDTLLTALERTAIAGRAVFNAAETEPDTPVGVVSIPRPVYPGALAAARGVGRVWMQFVVGPDGRAREQSFRPLLTDDPRFTSAAIYALRRGRFKPATREGRPASQRVFQVIEFRSHE